MKFLDRVLLFIAAVCAYFAQYNAAETHRHIHEIACDYKLQDHCQWVTK